MLILLVVALLLLLYAALELAAPGRLGARFVARRRVGAVPVSGPSLPLDSPISSPAHAPSFAARYTSWFAARLSPAARAAALVATLLLGIAIQLRIDGHPTSLAASLALLCLCGVATALLLLPSDEAAAYATATASVRPLMPAIGAVAGVICALVGAARVAGDAWTAQRWWFAAMALPLLALLIERVRARIGTRDMALRVDWRELGVMAALFAIALALRVPDITASPPFVHGDEALCGLDGRLFNQGRTPLLSLGDFDLPMLSYAICGFGLRLFGDDLTGLRLINATLGAISVVLVYLLARELFARRAAILSALVLAVTFLDVDVSRDGNHYVQGPLAVTLTLYLVARWLKRGGALTAFLAGVSMIVDLQVYWSARVAPLLVLCLALFLAVENRAILAARWRQGVWVAVGLITSGLPLLALFRANPGTLAGHDSAVSIFNGTPDMVGHLRSVYNTTDMVSILAQQAWRVLTTFNQRPDASLQIGWNGSMLDTVSAALLPAALALALLRVRRWEYALCLGWFGSVVAAGIITVDPPWWPRLAALLPAIALMIGVLLAECMRAVQVCLARVKLRGPLIVAGVGVLLACITIGNARLIFFDYPSAAGQTGTMGPTLLGRFLASAPGAQQTVLLSDGSFYVDYVTVRFLAPRSGGCTLMPTQPLSRCPVARTSHLYVLLPGRSGDLAWLERQRPGGRVIQAGSYNDGASRIVAYELGNRS